MTPTIPIRVLVVEPHPAVRSGLVALLGRHSDMLVVGEAADCAEAAHRAVELRPDVVTIDAGAAARATAAALGALRSPGRVRIVLMCALTREIAVEALLGGSETWCWKDSDDAEIAAAIRRSAE
jgi:DNA-binding NarL/FixJ family response regulator